MMRFPFAVTVACCIALGACRAERVPETASESSATTPAQTPPVATSPTPPAAEPTLPEAAMPDGDRDLARFDGYGDLKFGIEAAQMRGAWGGELREIGKDFNEECYFMTPTWVKIPSEFNFMIGDGKFVRYGTESAKFIAPGGGKVGMDEAALQVLYKNGLKSSPHKYVQGGHSLEISASGVAPSKLIFETDAKGIATEWRVGLAPQVDYVEGCS